jgi:hypothetical protein
LQAYRVPGRLRPLKRRAASGAAISAAAGLHSPRAVQDAIHAHTACPRYRDALSHPAAMRVAEGFEPPRLIVRWVVDAKDGAMPSKAGFEGGSKADQLADVLLELGYFVRRRRFLRGRVVVLSVRHVVQPFVSGRAPPWRYGEFP